MTAYQLNKEFVKSNKMLKYFGWLSVGIVASTGLALIFRLKIL